MVVDAISFTAALGSEENGLGLLIEQKSKWFASNHEKRKLQGLQRVCRIESIWSEVHRFRLREQVVCAIAKPVVSLQRSGL